MVCLGNICRSPAAEGVLLAHLERRGLAGVVSVDSAGTSACHVGDPADTRMLEAAGRRGYDLPSIARAVRDEDGRTFDLILAMDRENLANLDRRGWTRARLLGDFVPGDEALEVPDPYYGGDDGFERVLDLLESAMPALMDELEARVKGKGARERCGRPEAKCRGGSWRAGLVARTSRGRLHCNCESDGARGRSRRVCQGWCRRGRDRIAEADVT